MKKITNIFEQKQKINELIDKISSKNASFKDMNDVLGKLSKFDSKVVSDILFKRLKGSYDEFYISSYVIKELSNHDIVPEIINLIFEKDFDDERKAVLVAILDEMGVDISSMDISSAFEDIEKVGKIAVESFLDEWEGDYISLSKSIELLYDVPENVRFSIIDDICSKPDNKSFDFIKRLLTSDDKHAVKRILENLSKSNNSNAITAIKNSLVFFDDEENKNIAERLLRKFSFKGMIEEKKIEKVGKLSKLNKIYCTPIDGVGSSSLWITRTIGTKIECMFILINEKKGIKDCFGNILTKVQFNKMIKQYFDDGLNIYEIDFEKAIKLIKNAILINKTNNILISPAFHFLKENILQETNLSPEEYIPEFKEFNLRALAKDFDLRALTKDILEKIPECESWFVMSNVIYDIAEKVLGDKKAIVQPPRKQLQEAEKHIIENNLEVIKKRLLFTADLLNSSSKISQKTLIKIKTLLCTYQILEQEDPENSIFLSRVANFSLFHAQMALLSGFDFRKNPEMY